MSADNVKALEEKYKKLAERVAVETAPGTPERHRLMHEKQAAFTEYKKAADAQAVGQPVPQAVGGVGGNFYAPEVEGEGGEDDGGETFGEEGHTLAQLEGLSDEQLLEKPGIGAATVQRIHAARRTAARTAAKKK